MTSEPKHTGDLRFSDLNLDKRLLDAISKIGFEYCTPIQAETLPWTLACEDLIGQAQTGTGKTAAFLITAIQSLLETPIDEKERFASEPRVLALAPPANWPCRLPRTPNSCVITLATMWLLWLAG